MHPSTASAPPWCPASVLGVTHVPRLNCYLCARTVPTRGLTSACSRRPSAAVRALGRRRFGADDPYGRYFPAGTGVWIASRARRRTSRSPSSLTQCRVWGATGLSFAYALSLPIVVLLLLVVGVWGGVGSIRCVGTRVAAEAAPPRVPLGRARGSALFTLALGLGACPATAIANRIAPAALRPRSLAGPADQQSTSQVTSRHDKHAGGCRRRRPDDAPGGLSRSGPHSRRRISRAPAAI